MKHSEAFVKLVEEIKPSIKETTPEVVLKRQQGGEKFYFIDVREDHEWVEGHARGAQHIGRGVIERDIEKLIPNKTDEIVLYCGGGFRSALAAYNIQKMGYTNVISMDGGIRRWRELGYPEEKPLSAPTKAFAIAGIIGIICGAMSPALAGGEASDAFAPIQASTAADPAGMQLMFISIGLLFVLVFSIFAGTMYYMCKDKGKGRGPSSVPPETVAPDLETTTRV